MARKEKKIPRLHLYGKSHEEKRVKYQCWNIKEEKIAPYIQVHPFLISIFSLLVSCNNILIGHYTL